jgi:hypothetical protein
MSWIAGSNKMSWEDAQDLGMWYFRYVSEAYPALMGEC